MFPDSQRPCSRCLAHALGLDTRRIQFTPDMMPADILGTEVIQTDPATGDRSMRFIPGPIFTNILLADEINRTPPKTQAALLEAMAERQVSVAGETRPLERPFIVLATQNPIEQDGTYPLPEAQLDRFMLSLVMEYPKAAEERLIVSRGEVETDQLDDIKPMFTIEELRSVRTAIKRIPVPEHVVEYAVDLVRATRPDDTTCPARAAVHRLGCRPSRRSSHASRARCLAALEGAPAPGVAHIQRVASPVLRHRLVLNYTAAAEGLSPDRIVELIVESVDPAKA
ncbi:MAG: AAA family ATPase [Phycisphaerales bacterium]